MEYYDYQQIVENKTAIQSVFDSLMCTRALVCRPHARQWLFFKACAECLFDIKKKNEIFIELSKVTAAQYKFEVEDKLRRFYQRPGKKHDYVFTLSHKSRLADFGLSTEIYPSLAGYSVLVRDMSEGKVGYIYCRRELIAYLERVVAEGMAAEFESYMSLPKLDTTGLNKWFVEDCPAMREIKNVLQGVAKRGWHLNNPLNPSTSRLLSVVVKEVTEKEAEVSTKEYWYLRWWEQHRQKYTYPYRETNQQKYILKKLAGKWLIFQNIRPVPRSSQPLRWNRK